MLACCGLGAAFVCTGLFVLIIFKLNADYYEDVLASTEVSFSAITAKKEGRVAEAAPRKVKIGRKMCIRDRGKNGKNYGSGRRDAMRHVRSACERCHTQGFSCEKGYFFTQ